MKRSLSVLATLLMLFIMTPSDVDAKYGLGMYYSFDYTVGSDDDGSYVHCSDPGGACVVLLF